MPRTEASGEFAGIFDGAVVFFIRGEDFPVTVEAEGFSWKSQSAPLANSSQSGFSGSSPGQQTILLSGSTARKPNWRAFGRMNVKEGDFHIENLPGFAVRNRDELDRIADRVAEFLLECQAAEGPESCRSARRGSKYEKFPHNFPF